MLAEARFTLKFYSDLPRLAIKQDVFQ